VETEKALRKHAQIITEKFNRMFLMKQSLQKTASQPSLPKPPPNDNERSPDDMPPRKEEQFLLKTEQEQQEAQKQEQTEPLILSAEPEIKKTETVFPQDSNFNL